MRLAPLAAALIIAGGPAFAHTKHHHRHHTSQHVASAGGERPVDLGPNTPEANKAYQGGGVILQGAPGAPAPTPQGTPPGQMPQNAVPQ